MGTVMDNEIELLQKFRADTPGPSASAWARAESAVAAAMSGAYPAAHGHRPGRITRLRPGRRMAVAVGAAVVALVAVAAVLAVVPTGGASLTKPVRTAWQPARKLPTPTGHGGRAGAWQLASYLVSAGWQVNTAGPEAGPLTCPTATTCYVEGNNAASASGPADMNSFYVTTDGAANWSVLPLPSGITFTSALSCGSAASCAAGALYQGQQPVLIVTSDGGHSWTIDPLPARNGRIFKLSCPSPGTCMGLSSTTGKPITPGFLGLMASVRLVTTTDGGGHFTETRFPSGEAMQDISCPTASHCVTVGLYTASVPNTDRAVVMVSRDGGRNWRQGTLPRGIGLAPFPQITCPDTAHCWTIGSIGDFGNSVMAVSANGGATWTARSLPASVPEPQLSAVACPAAATCYVAGEDAAPERIGNTYNAGSAVVAVTRDGGKSWTRVSFPAPARVPGGMNGDAFMAIGQIQCPQAGACVALGVSDQGSKATPVYTTGH